MNVVPVLETHSVVLEIGNAPDVPADGRHLVPNLIEVTYQWTPPAHRRSGENHLRVQVKVDGRRRLKSGDVGRSGCVFLMDEYRGWPEWIGELVAARLPQGWDK